MTEDQKRRRDILLAGNSAVANKRTDGDLIAWAKRRGLAMQIDCSTLYKPRQNMRYAIAEIKRLYFCGCKNPFIRLKPLFAALTFRKQSDAYSQFKSAYTSHMLWRGLLC
jgi:hypothetical protein